MKKKYAFYLLCIFFSNSYLRAQDTPFPLKKLTIGSHNIGFNTYARTGFGFSKGDTSQVCFTAPGANYKYRLGNEADHYLETQIFYEYLLDSISKKSFEFVYMGAFQKFYGETKPSFVDLISQLYAKLNNTHKNVSFWLGKRYYERQQHNITDHFWLNPGLGSIGFGVEGILGSSQYGSLDEDLKFALFKYENDLIKEKESLNTYALDARWVRIPLNKNGKLNIWGTYSLRPPKKHAKLELRNGYGLGFWHNQTWAKEKIKNTFTLLYRKGASMKEVNAIKEHYLIEGNIIEKYNLNKTYSLFIANHAAMEFEKVGSLEGVISYKLENNGLNPFNINDENSQKAKGDKIHWFSTGARYIHYLHKHFNLALEVGLDYLNNKTDISGRSIEGWLNKFTFSPQITWDYGYWSRPVIRPFMTYAFWNKSMEGLVGNSPGKSPYLESTNGFSCGIQMEIWF